MWRVKTSRWLNHNLLSGNPDEMVSARVYREKRSTWCLILNIVFLPVDRRWGHCRRVCAWERRRRMTDINHTQCGNDRCATFFPAVWLYQPDESKGYVSPESGEHYCSRTCCEEVEGDPLARAYQAS